MEQRRITKEQIYEGELILVNAEYAFYAEEKMKVKQIPWQSTIFLYRKAANLLESLVQSVHAEDDIIGVSGYRSVAEQKQIYQTSLAENGAEFTAKYVALPQHSEHHTGLAIDVGIRQAELDFLCPYFPQDGIAGCFREKTAEYGFVERYRKGKESITGIAHEPWHFRYVGIPHAEIMTERNLCLEEYHLLLKQFPYGKQALRFKKQKICFEISYINMEEKASKDIVIPDCDGYLLSGNNQDGMILTIWRQR